MSIELGGFELLSPLNKGGMGEVWLGRQMETNLPVAVKVITGERAQQQYFSESFRNEVRMVAGLDHPGIVMVLDYGEITAEAARQSDGALVEGSPYLVQEYAGSGSLMAARKRVMAWPELRAVLLALLDALSHAHARGVIHRDLKPGNVLVCGMDDLRPGLKLCDFGLARIYEDQDQPAAVERVRGTLHYMSPEQCLGRWRDQGPWTDLYALGVLGYALASGRLPFKGLRGRELMKAHISETPPVLPNRRGIPKGFVPWLETLMAKDIWTRFRCAADASYALCQLPEPDDMGPKEWVLPDLATALGITDTLTGAPPAAGTRTDTQTMDFSDVETVMSSPVRAIEDGDSDVFIPRRSPPMSRTWRAPRATPPSVQLVGAGLGLFGLRTIPMVGREEERDQLWYLLMDVHRYARTRVVFLTGQAGTGATRLSEWIGSQANEFGVASTLVVSHGEQDGPWEAMRLALERAVQSRGLSKTEIAERVGEFYGRRGHINDPDVVAMAEFLNGELDRGREELVALVSRFLQIYSWERPVLMRVENVQWGREIMPVMKYLFESEMAQKCPLLVVVTMRDQALADSTGSMWAPSWLIGTDQFCEVQLGPLSRSEREELTKELLCLEGQLAVRVEQLCGGNPMFAIELVGDWVSRGVLEVGERGFRLKQGVDLTLPDSLHAVWNERVAKLAADLPSDAQVFLERAAVLGDRVWDTEWALVCRGFETIEEDETAIHQKIGRLRQRLTDQLYERRMAIREESGWRFSHPLLRESVLRMAQESGRLRAHHEICVEFLKHYGIPSAPGYSDRLGKHLQMIGDAENALKAMLEAADSWSLAHDHGQCLDVLARCDELLDSLDVSEADGRRVVVLEKRVHCHFQRGEYVQADKWMERAIGIVQSLGNTQKLAELYLDCVQYAWTRGRGDHANEWMSQANTLLTGEPTGLVGLKWSLAQSNRLMRSGELPEATLWVEKAIGLARDLQEDRALGLALRDRGTIASLNGDFVSARECLKQARDVQELHGGLKEVANTVNRQGECERWSGNIADAETFYKEAVSIYHRAGASFSGHLPLVNLGILYTREGRLREALVPLTRALSMVERQGNSGFQVITRILLLPCCAKVEDWAGWNMQIEQVFSIRKHISLVEPDLVYSVRLAAELAEANRRHPEAVQACDLAIWMYEILRDFDGREHMSDMRDRLHRLLDPNG